MRQKDEKEKRGEKGEREGKRRDKRRPRDGVPVNDALQGNGKHVRVVVVLVC